MPDLKKIFLVATSTIALTGCPDDEGTTGLGIGVGSTGDATTSGTSNGVSESASASNSGDGSSSTSTASNSGDPTTADSTAESTAGTDSTTDTTTGTDSTTGDEETSGETTSGETTSSSTGDESSSSTGQMGDGTHQLYQGVFNGAQYEYGFGNAIEILDITGGPDDTDWSRWAMLNGNGSYRLYFMREGGDDTIYQFVYNPVTEDYEFGLGAAIDELGITGAPADADFSSFAMLYGQDEFRLYAQSISDPLRVHQFAYNSATQSYEYGFDGAIPEIDVTMFPAATDFSGWGMLWENDVYRFYAFSDSNHDAVAQGAYNSSAGDYQFGFDSIPVIDIIGFPADTNTDDFAMLHDGDDFRLYMMRE